MPCLPSSFSIQVRRKELVNDVVAICNKAVHVLCSMLCSRHQHPDKAAELPCARYLTYITQCCTCPGCRTCNLVLLDSAKELLTVCATPVMLKYARSLYGADAQQQLNSVEHQLSHESSTVTQLQAEQVKTSKHCSDLKSQLAAAQDRNDEQSAELLAARSSASDMSQAHQALQEQHNNQTEQLSEMQAEVDQANSRYQTLQSQLASNSELVEHIEQELASKYSEVETLRQSVAGGFCCRALPSTLLSVTCTCVSVCINTC